MKTLNEIWQQILFNFIYIDFFSFYIYSIGINKFQLKQNFHLKVSTVLSRGRSFEAALTRCSLRRFLEQQWNGVVLTFSPEMCLAAGEAAKGGSNRWEGQRSHPTLLRRTHSRVPAGVHLTAGFA